VHAGGEPHTGPPVPRAGVLAEAAEASLTCVRTPAAAAPADGGRGGGRHSRCASEPGSGSGLQTRPAADMRGAERDGAAAGPGMEAALNGDEEGLEDLLADLRAAPRREPAWRACWTLPAAHAAQNVARLRVLATALIRLCCRGSAAAEGAARDNNSGVAVDPACVSSHRLRLYTRCCRMEMYVAQHKWEAAPMCALPLGPAHAEHHESTVPQPNQKCKRAVADRVQRAALAGAVRALEQRMQAVFAGASRAALAAYIRRLSDCVGPPPQLPAAALAAAQCGAGGPAAACVRAHADAAGHRRGEAAPCLVGRGPGPVRAPRVVAVRLEVGGGSGAERVHVTLASACGAGVGRAGGQPNMQHSTAPCVAAASALPRAASGHAGRTGMPLCCLPAGAAHLNACWQTAWRHAEPGQRPALQLAAGRRRSGPENTGAVCI